ncbi:hypothetical protein V6N13_103625 [Hibiscus sabdariffa]
MGDKEEEEWSGSESGDYTSEDEGTEDYRRGGYHYESAILSRTDVTLSKGKLGWGHFSTVWLSWGHSALLISG